MKTFKVVVNGNEYEVGVEEVKAGTAAPRAAAAPAAPKPAAPTPAAPKPVTTAAGAGAGVNTVTAPMPGTIINVGCHAGAKVSKGDILVVLEAMKMENEIMAPHDGTVTEVRVQQGASVNAGDILVVLS
ncbi:biotin/lipoyl-containing protein [uncultured Ilyobacter sp.]|uniref:biotin/lipoyl-containing protein n=1 Tax=uncultured Ilyobacter sp. TaxID=544433 RepID=UPI0029F55117|nr:biotin/lipoyl-containing protein [uncultured Ilyobacter sp.]